ncbi:MAG: hypothetical protein C4K60_09505 [Ideonella sp. MAG2]|nr:MAG: hypothetical protein C4K60_09505 [Ideonella sp. MAG2]
MLLALALPRIWDTQGAARQAMLQRMASQMRAAADLFYLQCQAAGGAALQNNCAEVTVGRLVVEGQHRYPVASLNGIGRLVGLSAGEPAAAHFQVREFLADGVPALSVQVRPAEKAPCELMYVQARGPSQRPAVFFVPESCH